MTTDPVNRTILLLDIERFSDRDDVEQAYLRRMLYGIADRTLEAAGIDETRRLRADRGDSVMELIDASAPVTSLLRALLSELPAQLRTQNRMASSTAQMRLRAVLASGYVAVDEQDGWVGSDLNHACRLLDAGLLRTALAERRGDVALLVSDSLHQGVVRHGHPGIPAEEFRAVTVKSKNGPLKAWLHGPPVDADVRHESTDEAGSSDTEAGAKAEAGATAEAEAEAGTKAGAGDGAGDGAAESGPAAAAVNIVFNGGSPSFGGSLVGRDQHGVSGGTVHGDVHLSGTQRGAGS